MFGLEKVATKLIITGVISLSILAGGWYMWNTIQRLEAEKKSLLVENDSLRYVNQINLKTITALEKNQELASTLIKKLNVENAKDKGQLDSLRAQIDNIKAEDNGPVAKVLKDTITGIQSVRKTRKEIK